MLLFRVALAAMAVGAPSLMALKTQSAAITFDEPAGTADHVLADLGKAAGVSLRPTPDVAKEVLLISVKNAPLSDLMKRIATVASAQWQDDNGGYVLAPDNALRESQRQEDLAAKTARIKKSLDQMRQQAETLEKGEAAVAEQAKGDQGKDQGDQGKANQQTTDAGPDMPFELGSFGSLPYQLIYQIDPATIAQMGKDDRLVFSSNPTAMQLPLPPVQADIVEKFIKDHNKQVAEIQKSQEQQNDQASGLTQGMLEQFGLDQMFKPIQGMPAKILLSVQAPTAGMESMMDSYGAELMFYDSNGKVIYSEQAFIPQGGQDSPFEAMAKLAPNGPLEPPKPAPQPGGNPIEISPLSKEFMKFSLSGEMMSRGAMPKVSADLKARLLHPDNFDPLSFAPSEALKAIAAEKSEQLVADLPDSIASDLGSEDQIRTTGVCRDNLKQNAKLVEDNGWLQISPSEPNEARVDRTDRKALALFVQSAEAKGVASLDDLAQYALANEQPTLFSNMLGPYMMLWGKQLVGGVFLGSNEWKTLQLYGLMDPVQREALRRSQFIPLSSLTPEEREIVRAMVYGSRAKLQEGKPDDPKDAADPLTQIITSFTSPSAVKDYLQEPTESLPQGLPDSAGIVCNFKTETIVEPSESSPMDALMGPMGVSEYSLVSYFMKQPMAQQQQSFMPDMSKLRVGSRGAYDIVIRLLPSLYIRKSLTDDSMPKDAPIVSADALPEDFKAQAKTKMDQFKNSPLAKMIATMPFRMPGATP